MRKLQSDRYKSGEKALTKQEYDKLLSVITDLQDELLIRMAVATGLRREDLCNVEVAKINLEDKTLLFHEAKKDRKDKATGNAIEKWRTIELQNIVIVTIEKFWRTLPKEQQKRQYLFDFVGRTAYRHFNHWCEVAGIPQRPFHSLRATCIKFAHANGWTDEQIAKITGDKISTIQEHYMTPSVDEMREVTSAKGFA